MVGEHYIRKAVKRVVRDATEAPLAVEHRLIAKPHIDVSKLDPTIQIDQSPTTHWTDVTDLQVALHTEGKAAGIPRRALKRLRISFTQKSGKESSKPKKGKEGSIQGVSVRVTSPLRVPDLFQPSMWKYDLTHMSRRPKITIDFGQIPDEVRRIQRNNTYTENTKRSLEIGLEQQTRAALFKGLWTLSHRREHQKLRPFLTSIAVYSLASGYLANLLAKSYIGISTSTLDFLNDVWHSPGNMRKIGLTLLGVAGWAAINRFGFGAWRDSQHRKKFEARKNAFYQQHGQDDFINVILPPVEK